jgi:hypothetical protein
VCKGCALGENVRVVFPRSESTSKGILNINHLYVSGLISIASLQRSSFYVMFIDYFLGKFGYSL